MFLFEMPMHQTEGTAEFMSKETTACFGGTTLGKVDWWMPG